MLLKPAVKLYRCCLLVELNAKFLMIFLNVVREYDMGGSTQIKVVSKVLQSIV